MTYYSYRHADCIEGSHSCQYCRSNPREDLMNHLERSIQASDATPGRLVNLVPALPVISAPSHRTLTPVLMRRPEGIARHHADQAVA